MATVRIPPVLRPAVGGEKELSAEGASVGEILRAVAEEHPDTQNQLFAADGGLNRYVNVYLNDEDVHGFNGIWHVVTATSSGKTTNTSPTTSTMTTSTYTYPSGY